MRNRRNSLILAAALTAACCLGSSALAQAWPTKAVRLVVPSLAGTAPDIVIRVMGDKLSKAWGQPVLVDNRPGAVGMIGLGAIKIGTQDDHAFAFVPASAITLSPYMFESAQVDAVRDFVPVALVAEGPMMMAVSAMWPANSLADVIAVAKKNPDTFVVILPLLYSVPHLAGEVLTRTAGVPIRAVPNSNRGAAIAEVMNNDSQVIIDGIPPTDPMVQGGKLKAIAVFSDGRLPNRPQLATVAETYPGLVINGWFGIIALKGTRDKAIQRFNRDVIDVSRTPELTGRFDAFGVHAKSLTPAQFGKYWNDDRLRR